MLTFTLALTLPQSNWCTYEKYRHVYRIERDCGFVEILSTFNVQWIYFFRVPLDRNQTEPCIEKDKNKKKLKEDEAKKNPYNVDLGKFMVTKSDIGLPTYSGILKNVVLIHSDLGACVKKM